MTEQPESPPATGLPGGDVAAIIAATGSVPATVLRLGTPPFVTGTRGSWRVGLADGRTLKVRSVASTERAAVLSQVTRLTGGLPLAATLARRGTAMLEEWIEGPALDSIDIDRALGEELGSILGRISTTGMGNALLAPQRRSVASLLAKLDEAFGTLVAAGLVDVGAAERLTARARANAPGPLPSGLVHLDFQARNVVLGSRGPTLIDNELLDIGILDLDLARTWCLWPMSAATQSAFLRGYARHRPVKEFLLHELFWAIHTVTCSLAYRHASGLDTGDLLAALGTLNRGDLPRAWAGATSATPAERVRLAFICDYLAIGGQERICLEMIRGLDRRRFEPFLYAFRGGALEPAFRALGIPVVIGSSRDPLHAEKEWTDTDRAEKEAYQGRLTEALRRDSIDAALVFAWRDAAPAAQCAGVRVMIEKLDGPALLGKIGDKSGYDRVVAESTTLLAALTARAGEFGLDEERIEYVFPGIDLEQFDPGRFDRDAERDALGFGPADLVVGTVGRLIPDKNVKLLVRAFATITPEAIPDTLRLLVVGPDGGALDGLRTLASNLGISERVTFLPATSHVAPVLAAIDVFAMTSLREGLPTVILEAMAMGLPVVTTGAGSIPEVMEGNGFLIPGFGPEGIGQRIAKLCVDRELRAKMGQRSRAIATRFASRHSIGRYEEMILECLATKPR
jgi:glycosyltransferase involved in cell wall biosynthesis